MELNPGSIVGYKPKTVDIMIPDERTQDYYMTTSTWVAFKDNVEAVGLRGMFGCTAVIFVSQRGAWVGHFWESNFQSDTVPEEEFEFRILHEPKQGYREGNWKHQYHEYGWAELGFHPNLGDPGVMFGNKDDKYYEADLRVFIITPRPRGKYYDENHVLLPDDVIHDINRNAGQLQFPGKIKRLSQEIKEVYGEDTKIEVIDYAAKLLKKEDMDLAMENKLTGAQIFHLQADSDFKEARGKLLLQYRPAKTCADLASWRLWVENQGIGGRVSCGYIATNTERLNICSSDGKRHASNTQLHTLDNKLHVFCTKLKTFTSLFYKFYGDGRNNDCINLQNGRRIFLEHYSRSS
ncbi:uncharacterized protein LY79DRAFT_519159 [Colletotrichum navitas]|uniref:Uncharacterized protein n=1 Tax=Colletotrichum navitas TaxID=681940 RepID=A0AAD8PVK1_9PEZI|nr:uncharacterized protein LY79DRAFT_519159 [Colletotrichum navitas]KAK1585282.1 hypothetical protein LY79DRAFT_519159 [Colletotrichum navitas]